MSKNSKIVVACRLRCRFFLFFLGAGNDQKARAMTGEGSGEGVVGRVDRKEGVGKGKMRRGHQGGGD